MSRRVATSRIASVSMISTPRCASRHTLARRLHESADQAADRRAAPVRLKYSRNSGRSPAQAVRRRERMARITQLPIAAIKPFCSANGMKRGRREQAALGWFQRIRASQPLTSPVGKLDVGLKMSVRIDLRATASVGSLAERPALRVAFHSRFVRLYRAVPEAFRVHERRIGAREDAVDQGDHHREPRRRRSSALRETNSCRPGRRSKTARENALAERDGTPAYGIGGRPDRRRRCRRYRRRFGRRSRSVVVHAA